MSTSKNSRSGGASKSGGTKSKSKSGGSRASSTTKSTGNKKPAATTSKKPQAKPLRREIGAVVCLLLAIFAALGYFSSFDWAKGAFISFFGNLIKGLFGYGFWFAPPALLIAAVVLAFHRGRPVKARVVCTLLLPFVFGGLLHLLKNHGQFALGFDQIKLMWTAGRGLASGGAVAGWVTVALSGVFSRIGAAVIYLLALFCFNMVITKITPVDIWDGITGAVAAVRNYIRSRPAYEEQEPKSKGKEAEVEEEEPFVEDISSRVSQRRTPVSKSKKRSSIDISLDEDDPFGAKRERPASYFDNKPGVRPPHELLEMEEAAEAAKEKPVVEPAKVAVATKTAEIKTAVTLSDEGAKETVDKPVVSKAKVREEKKEEAVKKAEPSKKPESPVSAPPVEPVRPVAAPEVYQYPPVSLLNESGAVSDSAAAAELQSTQELLDDTLQSFGIDARIINVTRGPSVTRYELELTRGVKLNKLTNLAGDIALSLGAASVRIAPIPGRSSVVGIEVPNQLVTTVPIREVIDSKEFRTNTSKVAFAVGKDISGRNVVGNIAKLPHMLIAGTTGSGKSVCTNSLIISLLYKSSPDDVRLIMVDPKMVELGNYNGIPHLLIPVVTDPKKAAGALQWAVSEMMKRYRLFSEVGVRDLASYNELMLRQGEKKLPQVVVVIDELADLMLVAAKEVEESICRVAQMGRASGMHLVIATQRPSSDVITGLMKANIPSRIAFAVASSLESRIILDNTGAEKLVGKGDMLYAPLGMGKPQRVQGCMITDEEVARVVEFIKQNSVENYDNSVMQEVESNAENAGKKGKGGDTAAPANQASGEGAAEEADELLPSAIEVVVETGMASVSMLQRRLKLGYSRAARLVDQMEERGIVGPFEGSKPRQVLVTKEEWQQMKMMGEGGPAPTIDEAEFAAALAMSEAADADADLPDYTEDDDMEGEAPF